MIIMDDSFQSVIIVIHAFNADLDYVAKVFTKLVQSKFTQCIIFTFFHTL